MGRVQWELRSQLCVLDYSVWLLGQCASRDKSENHPQRVEQRVGSWERAWVQRRPDCGEMGTTGAVDQKGIETSAIWILLQGRAGREL